MDLSMVSFDLEVRVPLQPNPTIQVKFDRLAD